jgi:putative N-acetylmannosamine-6-phosphate epimerase/L-amino acid N-acyltransferase YncA
VRIVVAFDVIDRLKGGLIVSTQADPASPLANPVVIAAMAEAAEAAGCVGHRINTPEHLRAVRAACHRPIIGIYKVVVPGFDVYITPTLVSAREVAEAGGDVIAIDGTPRARPSGISLGELIAGIHETLKRPVMADVSTLAEGVAAAELGVDVVATTMAGYTPETADRKDGPDLQLVRDLAERLRVPIVAEGRYWQPSQVAAAFAAGAHAVVVGTAITAIGWLTSQFVQTTPAGTAAGRSTQARARPAMPADAEEIARIYNDGIADRIATFETRPRTREDVLGWFDGRHPIVVVEAAGQIAGFASTSTYRPRACYDGVAEFSVYVARSHRGRGIGRLALEALITASETARLWKLVSRVFVENTASRALLRNLSFREVGTYEKHGKLDGAWRDVVIVERLISTNLG